MKWNSFKIIEELAIVGLPYVNQDGIRLFSNSAYFHNQGGARIGDTVELPVTAGSDMYVVGQNVDFEVALNVNEYETFLNVIGKIHRIQKYLLWAYEPIGGEPTECACEDTKRIIGTWKKDHGRDIHGYVIDLSDVTITLKKLARKVPEYKLPHICPDVVNNE